MFSLPLFDVVEFEDNNLNSSGEAVGSETVKAKDTDAGDAGDADVTRARESEYIKAVQYFTLA